MFEYLGNKAPFNRTHVEAEPSNELIAALSDLCVSSLKINQAIHSGMGVPTAVGMTQEAQWGGYGFEAFRA